MERKIGEVFVVKGKKYEGVEGGLEIFDCSLCDLAGFLYIDSNRGRCVSETREDGKNVYFVAVKE